jgi:hypothetical protein
MNIKSQKTINLLRNSGRYLNSNEFYLIKNGVNAQRAQIISALEENKASDKVKVVQPAKAVKKGKVATNSAIGQQMNKSSQPKAAVIPEPMNPKKAAKLALKTNLVKNDQLTKVGKQTQKALTDKFINLTNEVRSINNALVKYNNLGAANAEKSIIETNLEVTRKNTVAASQKAYNASFTGDLAGSKRFHTEVSKLNTAESVANMKLEIVKGSIQSSEEAIRKLPNELRVTDKFTMQDLVKKSKAVMSKAEAAGIKISQFDNGVKTLADLKQEVKYLAKRTEKRFFVGKEFWVKSGRYTINTVKTLATKSVLGIAAIEGLIYTLGNASNVVFEYGELDSEEMTARFYNQLIKVDAEITALSK